MKGLLLAFLIAGTQLTSIGNTDQEILKESECLRLQSKIETSTVGYNAHKKPQDLESLKKIIRQYKRECGSLELYNRNDDVYLRFNH